MCKCTCSLPPIPHSPQPTFAIVENGAHKERLLAGARELGAVLLDQLEQKRRRVLENSLPSQRGVLFPNGWIGGGTRGVEGRESVSSAKEGQFRGGQTEAGPAYE